MKFCRNALFVARAVCKMQVASIHHHPFSPAFLPAGMHKSKLRPGRIPSSFVSSHGPARCIRYAIKYSDHRAYSCSVLAYWRV